MKRRIIATPRFNDRRIYLNRNMPNNLFYINAGGITYPDKNFYLLEHYRNHYAIQYIISGSGFVEYDGKKYELKAGDIFYMSAVPGIGYGTNPRNPFTKIWVNGSGKFWEMTSKIFDFTEPFEIIPANDSIMEYFHRIFDTAPEAETKREKGMGLITELFNEMYRFKNGETEIEEKNKTLDMSIEIKRYVDLHICDNKKLSDIASRFELSARTVYSKFKSRYGMSPAEYINGCRLELSREQLRRNDADVAEIAERVGFTTASYFCKVFKIRYGMSPQQYRKNCINISEF